MTAPALTFTLPYPTAVLNRLLRMHWSQRKKRMAAIAWDVKLATHGRRPAAPIQRARVTVVRYGLGNPDRDGLIGGCKLLLDTLVAPGPVRIVGGQAVARHPLGLGIIADDSPEHLEFIVAAVRVGKRAEARTEVTIEEIP